MYPYLYLGGVIIYHPKVSLARLREKSLCNPTPYWFMDNPPPYSPQLARVWTLCCRNKVSPFALELLILAPELWAHKGQNHIHFTICLHHFSIIYHCDKLGRCTRADVGIYKRRGHTIMQLSVVPTVLRI